MESRNNWDWQKPVLFGISFWGPCIKFRAHFSWNHAAPGASELQLLWLPEAASKALGLAHRSWTPQLQQLLRLEPPTAPATAPATAAPRGFLRMLQGLAGRKRTCLGHWDLFFEIFRFDIYIYIYSFIYLFIYLFIYIFICIYLFNPGIPFFGVFAWEKAGFLWFSPEMLGQKKGHPTFSDGPVGRWGASINNYRL